MPLLRAVDVRVRSVELPLLVEDVVSMPLLRAVDVRADGARVIAKAMQTSQCPCCGRAMCGLTSLRKGSSPPRSVSMPLLRAGDVRAMASTRCWPSGEVVSMPLLRAGDVRVRRSTRSAASSRAGIVSMPLLRAGDVRAWFCNRGWNISPARSSQCPCCGRAICGVKVWLLVRTTAFPCLNALVAGGRCAGAMKQQMGQRCLKAIASHCPCCGRAMCGAVPRAHRAGPPRLSQCPCCGRAMCGLEKDTPAYLYNDGGLNALVAGGRCAGGRDRNRVHGYD